MKNLKRFTTAAAVILIFSSVIFGALSDSVAVVSDHGGNAKVFTQGQWKNAMINMPVYEGDSVLTRSDSFIEITFDDATIVRLDADSEMKLSELKRQGSTAKTVFRLAKGKFFAIVDKLMNPRSKFEVHTPMAIAAVKGTELLIEADSSGTMLAVNTGAVHFKAKNGTEGVFVYKGKFSSLNKGRNMPVSPAEWRANERVSINFDKIRREAQIIRELKAKKGGGAVYKWRINKKKPDESKKNNDSNTQGTIGGTNEYIGKLNKNIRNRLKNKLKREMRGAKSHAVHDLKYINEHMKADAHLGKTMTDVHGNRIRTEEFIFRPAPRRVDFLSVTLREGRIDYMRGENIFRYALPENPTWKQWKMLWQKEWTALQLADADFFNPLEPAAGPRNYLAEQKVKLSNTKDWVYMATLYKPGLWYTGAAAPTSWKLLKDIEVLALGSGEPLVNLGTWGLMVHSPDLVKEQRLFNVLQETGEQSAYRGPLDKTFAYASDIDPVLAWIDDQLLSLAPYDDPYNIISMWSEKASTTQNNLLSGQLSGDDIPGTYWEENSMPAGSDKLAFRNIRHYNDGSNLNMTLALIEDYGTLKTVPDKNTSFSGLLTWGFDVIFNTNVEISAKSNVFADKDYGIDVVSRMLWWIMLNPKNAEYNSPDESNMGTLPNDGTVNVNPEGNL